MSSDNSSSASSRNPSSTRRVPKQERAERRVEAMLAAAGAVIARRGLDAATMTEIAAEAETSIGALYQYFPNRDAIATALRTAYAQEMDRRWRGLADTAEFAPPDELAHHLIELLTGFVDEHPAYLFLFQAAVKTDLSETSRTELRRRFADLFVRRAPALQSTEAMAIAEVCLMIVKGLVGLYAKASRAERKRLQSEATFALSAYLEARLAASAGVSG